MPFGISKILKKVPPFRRFYRLLDDKRQECSDLKQKIHELKKENKQLTKENKLLAREKEYYFDLGLTPDQYPQYLKEWYYRQTGGRFWIWIILKGTIRKSSG